MIKKHGNPLESAFPTSSLYLGYTEPGQKRIRVLWKISLAVVAIAIIFVSWQFGSAFMHGRGLADAAVRRIHHLLNLGQYEQIVQEADESFGEQEKHDELVNFLEVLHTRLGDAQAEKFANMTVNVSTDGTFLKTEYDTSFTAGLVVETFTWIKTGGSLKLFGYNVQSDLLLSR
jgi:hypothetical protein